MLHEAASSRDNRPQVSTLEIESDPQDDLRESLQQAVAAVLDIESATFADEDDKAVPAILRMMGSEPTARFVGQLKLDSELAYDQLDKAFTPHNHLALFRVEDGKHVIVAMRGRIEPKPRPWWPNLMLFIATVVSVLLVGTSLAISEIARVNPLTAEQLAENLIPNLWRGLPYALSILLILGGHELGHYFAARRHGLSVTLPYFIPLPILSPFGTMGAFIQLRQPMRNRKVLLDVGAAGPLVGLVFAIPLLFIGLAGARTTTITPGGLYEGDSVLYAVAKIVTFGEFLPNGGIDVAIDSSQLAWAGWTGLLVSALNLIPIGQLDGGHILYALLGDRARLLYYPLIFLMVGLVFLSQVWFLWVILLTIFGRAYATPLDMITPLDRPRKGIAILAMALFLVIFVPAPLTPNSAGPSPLQPRSTAMVTSISEEPNAIEPSQHHLTAGDYK